MEEQSEGIAQQEASRPATPNSQFYSPENLRTPEKQIGQAANVPSPRPYNTPIFRNEGSCKLGFLEPDADARYPRFEKEFRKCFTGPMPPDLFIDEFLPRWSASDRRMPSAEDAFIDIPVEEKDEKKIYDALVYGLTAVRRLKALMNFIAVQSH